MNENVIQDVLVYFQQEKKWVMQIDVLELLKTNDSLEVDSTYVLLIFDFLIENNLVIKDHNNSAYRLSPKSNEILDRFGSWPKYLEHIAEKEAQIEADEELERKAKRTTIRNNDWYHKTRWLPLVFSFISLVISIIVYIFR